MTNEFNSINKDIENDENEKKKENLESKLKPEDTSFDSNKHKQQIGESENSHMYKEQEDKSTKDKIITTEKECAKELGNNYSKIEEVAFDVLAKVGFNKYKKDIQKAYNKQMKNYLLAEKEVKAHEKDLYGNETYEPQEDLEMLLEIKKEIPEKEKSIHYRLRETENELELIGGAYREAEDMERAYSNKIEELKGKIQELSEEIKPENKAQIRKLNKEIRDWAYKQKDLEQTQMRYRTRIKTCKTTKNNLELKANNKLNYIMYKREESSNYASGMELARQYLSSTEEASITKTEEVFKKMKPFMQNLGSVIKKQEELKNPSYSRNGYTGINKTMDEMNRRTEKSSSRANANYTSLKSEVDDILAEEGI